MSIVRWVVYKQLGGCFVFSPQLRYLIVPDIYDAGFFAFGTKQWEVHKHRISQDPCAGLSMADRTANQVKCVLSFCHI